ncbi:hypothetical protein N0V90_010520 [Kalmusia sp. IMI 367209]|nr:hypothetical protein N0V90_010520 [Kalmusia sp. IMI 367209]
MPYLKTSAEWYEQSTLLLKARPTTTHITSKYTVLKPNARKIKKHQKYLEKRAARPADPSRPSSELPNAEEPTATFTLKTYDAKSGTCLQYETTKAAEVGRLIGSLGRLGRHMAALPEADEDLSAPVEGTGVSTPKLKEDEDVKMGGYQRSRRRAVGAEEEKEGQEMSDAAHTIFTKI